MMAKDTKKVSKKEIKKESKKEAKKEAKKETKKKGTTGGSNGPDDAALASNKTYRMVVAALDAPITKPPPASKEEMERRFQVGRNYVIGRFKRHNEEEHVLSCRIKLKNHAIDMLPKGTMLRQAALEIDDEGPPYWRPFPMWTPPIPGFDADVFIEEGEQSEGKA